MVLEDHYNCVEVEKVCILIVDTVVSHIWEVHSVALADGNTKVSDVRCKDLVKVGHCVEPYQVVAGYNLEVVYDLLLVEMAIMAVGWQKRKHVNGARQQWVCLDDLRLIDESQSHSV